MTEASEPIVFIGHFADIPSAITFSGNGTGSRLRIDAPESETAAIMRLSLLRMKNLKITVELYDATPDTDEEATGDDVVSVIQRTKASRRRAGQR